MKLAGVPDRLGPYTLAERLGEGAQAAVFLGHDPDGRPVAVKVRRAGDPDEDRRFLREFESMRLLRVPGVVAVHEAGVDGDLIWFSMDRVHGRPFHEAVLEERYLPDRIDRTVDLGIALLDTLAALHAAGFSHRDIKPSNVLVDPGGGVHVLDFGIGRHFAKAEAIGGASVVFGTVPYMAPEQLANLPTDARADLFAVGLMLHEAIAGTREAPPHVLGWIPRTCLERLPPLAARFREVPLALGHLVQRLLSVDPRDRPSARRAAAELKRIRGGWDSLEAPEPPFVDPGPWWSSLEGCIGLGSHPVQILEGPAGAGKRRLAEQIHRLGLLDQIWSVHLHCRADHVGGPVLELLEVVIDSFDQDAVRELVGDDGAQLRELWPQLALPTSREGPTAQVRATDVVASIVAVVRRLAAERAMLLVVHDVERVDPLTARVLAGLAPHAGRGLGLLLLVDPRWHRRLSRALVRRLLRHDGSASVTAEAPTAEASKAIAQALCPEPLDDLEPDLLPQLAVEAGLRGLARWRGLEWPEADASLWPLALRDAPLPATVYRALVGRRARTALVEQTQRGMVLATQAARRMARVRLASLDRSAALLAETWEKTLPAGTSPGEQAALWLLAGSPEKARPAAALAAVAADRFGRFIDARRWLMVIDAYPTPDGAEHAFDLARVRARVAIRTETSPRVDLPEDAAALSGDQRQETLVALLRTEFAIRRGELRTALVHSLGIASAAAPTLPRQAAQARLFAVQCRVLLGQLAEAQRELDRARAHVEQLDDSILEVQFLNWQAELARRGGDLTWCQALCQQAIRRAGQTDYSRGAGHAALRLAQVQRLLGRRRRAEATARAAQDAFGATGDVDLITESDLVLATLLVERGDVLHAQRLLDRTIRHVRALHLDHLLPGAMRCALQLATARMDRPGAELAIAALTALTATDDEVPAVLVRWWRLRGEMDRALFVKGPVAHGFGEVSWRIERARTLLARDPEGAISEARPARDAASAAGYGELATAAGLILGAAGAFEEGAWRDELHRARSSTSVDLALGALELEALHLTRAGDPSARDRWRTLRARARELGYRPAALEADGWLSDPERIGR